MNDRSAIYYVPPYGNIKARVHVPGHWELKGIDGSILCFGNRHEAEKAEAELTLKLAAARRAR